MSHCANRRKKGVNPSSTGLMDRVLPRYQRRKMTSEPGKDTFSHAPASNSLTSPVLTGKTLGSQTYDAPPVVFLS